VADDLSVVMVSSRREKHVMTAIRTIVMRAKTIVRYREVADDLSVVMVSSRREKHVMTVIRTIVMRAKTIVRYREAMDDEVVGYQAPVKKDDLSMLNIVYKVNRNVPRSIRHR